MRRTYVISHWLLTLLIAPFISQALAYVFPDPHQVVGLLEVYPITVLFSIVFSLPTFLICMLCFYFLGKMDVGLPISKGILIAVPLIGIIITISIIQGSMSQDIIVAYSITALVVGLILKLRIAPVHPQDHSMSI